MKRSWVIGILVFLAALVLGMAVGAYWFLDQLFPKAFPIETPPADSVLSISLGQNSDAPIAAKAADHGALLQYLSKGKPTRKVGVNDHPDVEPYYTVQIQTAQREYRYFVYEENGQVCIEVAYEGVYKADRQLLSLIMAYFP